MESWAGRLADWMDHDGAAVALGGVAHTLNHHRGRHAVFGTVCARDRPAAVAGLRALAGGQSGPGVVAPHAGVCGSGRVFVYSGQGSQWVGMGRRLLADEPAFAAAVAELEPVFVEQVGFSLQQVLAGGLAVSGIERIQPVLVGMQLALTELWRAYGVEPDAVVGHSMGEVAAAVVAGALSPAEGLRVIATRSQLMAQLSGRGAMALLELDADAAEAAVADFADVGVAVYASPRQTVIAGPPDQVDAVIAVVSGQDRLARRVDVDVASHHRIVDPILPQLRTALADLAPGVPAIPMFSTTHDHLSGSPTFDAGYWVDNLRRPVRFSHAIAAAAENHSTFIEISPHPLLTHAISETVGAAHHHAIATLQRDTDDTVTFHTNLNSTHTTHPPHTDHPPEPHPALPTTPWHHTHHWITTTTTKPAAGSAPTAGTLLGQRITVSSTRPAHLWQARLVPEAKPYPGFHRLHGVEVVPASVLLQTLLAAAAELGTHALSDVRFQHPVVVDRAEGHPGGCRRRIRQYRFRFGRRCAGGPMDNACDSATFAGCLTSQGGLARGEWFAPRNDRRGPVVDRRNAQGARCRRPTISLDPGFMPRSVGRLGGSRRCGRGIHGSAARRSILRRAAGGCHRLATLRTGRHRARAGGRCALGAARLRVGTTPGRRNRRSHRRRDHRRRSRAGYLPGRVALRGAGRWSREALRRPHGVRTGGGMATLEARGRYPERGRRTEDDRGRRRPAFCR